MRTLLRVALTLTALIPLHACSDDDEKPNGPVIVVANDAAPQPTGDGGDAASSAKKGLGEDCTGPEQCESNVCFVGTKTSWCSLACTAANAAQLCVPPAFDGTCNNQGYCRRPN